MENLNLGISTWRLPSFGSKLLVEVSFGYVIYLLEGGGAPCVGFEFGCRSRSWFWSWVSSFSKLVTTDVRVHLSSCVGRGCRSLCCGKGFGTIVQSFLGTIAVVASFVGCRLQCWWFMSSGLGNQVFFVSVFVICSLVDVYFRDCCWS